MVILAIESSAKASSVALCRDGALVGQYMQNSGLTHSRTLLPMAEDLLHNVEMSLADVDRIAVARGPGSFTGIRIGVAVAKGLAFAADKPVCGISTLEAMARQVPFTDGVVCAVMDARRDQVYNANFLLRDGVPERLCPDRAVSLEELYREIQADHHRYLLIGDGTSLCYNWLSKRGADVLPMPEGLRHQTAWGVALSAMEAEPLHAHDLCPEYIRPSQAERERMERLSQADQKKENV